LFLRKLFIFVDNNSKVVLPMKTKSKNYLVKSFVFVCNLVGVVACLFWLFLTDLFKSKTKSKPREGMKLDLKDITIPELGLKYLKSCQ